MQQQVGQLYSRYDFDKLIAVMQRPRPSDHTYLPSPIILLVDRQIHHERGCGSSI